MFKTIIRQAWQTTWHNPILWIFGFFIAPLASFEVNFLVYNSNQFKKFFDYFLTNNLSSIDPILFGHRAIIFFNSISIQNAIIFLFFIFIFFILANFSQACLIKTTKIFKLEAKENISFSQLFSLGLRNFWPVFFYNLLNLLIIGAASLLILPFFLKLITKFDPTNYFKLIFGLVLIFFIFFTLALFFIIRFSIFYRILEENKFFLAIKKACSFLTQNWLTICGLFALIVLTSLIFGLALFLISYFISIPFFILIYFFYFLKMSIGVSFFFVLSTIFYLGISLLIGGIFSSFQIFLWIFFFKNKVAKNIK